MPVASQLVALVPVSAVNVSASRSPSRVPTKVASVGNAIPENSVTSSTQPTTVAPSSAIRRYETDCPSSRRNPRVRSFDGWALLISAMVAPHVGNRIGRSYVCWPMSAAPREAVRSVGPLLVSIVLIAGCAAPPPPPSPSAMSPPPPASRGPAALPTLSPRSSPSVAPLPSTAAVPFSIDVVPGELPAWSRAAIADERLVFLVIAREGPGGRNDPFELSAEAVGAEVDWEPGNVRPGDVAEVTIVPTSASVVAEVTIRVRRNGVERTERRTVPVLAGEDDRGEEAAATRDLFVDWLASERSELEVDRSTAWSGTIARPADRGMLHYLFFSDAWEMGLAWPASAPPNDWVRMYLRHRWDEVAPSLAFEIASVDAGSEPTEIRSPVEVTR
jgi:hypothetical protein